MHINTPKIAATVMMRFCDPDFEDGEGVLGIDEGMYVKVKTLATGAAGADGV